MRTFAALIASALIVSACSRSETKAAEPEGESTAIAASNESEVAAVAEAVKAKLKDPASATFRNVRRVPFMGLERSTSKVYCGEVNARNSFGGFSGYSNFVVSNATAGGKEAHILEGDDVEAELTYHVLCVKDDKPIPGEEVTLGS